MSSVQSRINRLERNRPDPPDDNEYHAVISWEDPPEYYRNGGERIPRSDYPPDVPVSVDWSRDGEVIPADGVITSILPSSDT